LEIDGLKGRGMGLDMLPYGTVVLIAGGTGFFTYLDLLDIMFKIMVEDKMGRPLPDLNI
jgi:hypothetical protein